MINQQRVLLLDKLYVSSFGQGLLIFTGINRMQCFAFARGGLEDARINAATTERGKHLQKIQNCQE